MYVLGFKIGYDRNKRLWLIMLGAVTIALCLIVISFIAVYKNPKNNGINLEELSSILEYKEVYKANIISNKNQNSYNIEEEYKKDENGEFFEFKIFNGDEIITYILDNNMLSIKSSTQNLEYVLSDYIIKKENLLSIATFFSLYDEINKDMNKNFTINIEESDNKILYTINVNNKDKKYEFLDDISKLEIVVDKESNNICEYMVYNNEDLAYIDIMYNSILVKY